MGPDIKIQHIAPKGPDIEAALKKLGRVAVYVGIPAPKAMRNREAINNPSLLYIHTHGSPIRGIPPRPLIEPAIQAPDNKNVIADELAQAAKASMDGDTRSASLHLRRAGIEATNRIKAWFFDPRNNWPALKPATIKRKGSSQPLIDTAALRQSLTWVIRGESS